MVKVACYICHKAVSLAIAVADDEGRPCHEECRSKELDSRRKKVSTYRLTPEGEKILEEFGLKMKRKKK